MEKKLITIIIPTYNNREYLNPCVESIRRTGILNGFAELIIVNNGEQKIEEELKHVPMRVLKPGKNLGWEGGLKLGLENSNSEFVVFQNDDTFIPPPCSNIYNKLLTPFMDDNVAAVGPGTTIAAGWHSIYNLSNPTQLSEVPFLIYFTVMVRRKHLEAVGGIDDTLPGGDDLDLSMRFKKAGLKSLVCPGAFLIHHAFKTGERVKGSSQVNGGWNSQDMMERTNQALIRKHGFVAFIDTRVTQPIPITPIYGIGDPEGDILASWVPDGKVVELGCGPRKTVSNAIGVDIAPKGSVIKEIDARVSVADVVADVTKQLPFEDEEFDCVIARHILEHCVDAVESLREWTRILKVGGKLLIAVPNEHVIAGIPLNPEHCHAFYDNSLKNLIELLGYKQIESIDCKNGISFAARFEKLQNPNVSIFTSCCEAAQ